MKTPQGSRHHQGLVDRNEKYLWIVQALQIGLRLGDICWTSGKFIKILSTILSSHDISHDHIIEPLMILEG